MTWQQSRIADIAILVDRSEPVVPGKPYRQIGVRLWGGGAYERETIDGAQTKYARLSQVEEGDIVVNKIWARNGSVAVVPKEFAGSYVSSEFPIFEPRSDRLDSKWFHWITKSKAFWEKCFDKSHGSSGKNRIRPSQFLEIDVPLPPLIKQQELVSLLDSSFARSANIKSRLQYLVNRLGELRASTLASAVRGDLTERISGDMPATSILEKVAELRARGSLKAPKRSQSIAGQHENGGHLVALPDSWAWSPLEDLCERIVDCPHSTPRFEDSGMYCVDTTCLREGEIVKGKLRFVSKDTFEERTKRIRPAPGDIILGREGSIGNAAVVPEGLDVCLGQRVLLLRPFPLVDSRFVMWAINSPLAKEQISPLVHATGAPHLNVRDIKKLKIPLTSSLEQREIVHVIQGIFDRISKLDAALQGALALCSELEDSTLHSALSGKVPLS